MNSPIPLSTFGPQKHRVFVESTSVAKPPAQQMSRKRNGDSTEPSVTVSQRVRLLLVGFIVTCGGSFHFGYQISIINPLADVIQAFITESLESHLNTKLEKTVLHILWPTVAGLLFIGAFAGALVSSWIIRKFGLGRSFFIASLIICASLLMAFISKLIYSAELFILHRFVNGFGVGLVTTVQTVYLAEISPVLVRYRGFMGTLTGFSTSIGFVIASAVGLPQVFGQTHLWQWSYAVEMIPTIILMLALPKFLPPSPIRLLKEGDEKEALKSLTSFQNKDAALNQLQEFQREIRSERMENRAEIDCIGLLRHSRNTLIICLLLNATVSFSGIVSISFFGTLLLQHIGFSDNGAALANCLASFSGILGNIIGSLTVDKIGRRILIIGCLSVLAAMNIIQALLIFYFQASNDYRTGYAFLAIFMAFLFVFSLGTGPMAWFISTELSAVDARDRIQSLSISCQYVTCFISSLIFLPLYHNTGPFSFLLFICPLSFCAIYLFIYLPETKNRPIEDILEDLQQRSLLGKVPPTD